MIVYWSGVGAYQSQLPLDWQVFHDPAGQLTQLTGAVIR
jgi:hypothetical protein